MEQEQAGVRFSISSPAPRRLRSIPRGGLDFTIGVEGSSRVILWPQPLVAPFLNRAACDQQCHNERRCNSNNQPRTQTTQYTIAAVTQIAAAVVRPCTLLLVGRCKITPAPMKPTPVITP